MTYTFDPRVPRPVLRVLVDDDPGTSAPAVALAGGEMAGRDCPLCGSVTTLDG